jgi:L-alanine-DL-glutamate epimerase-like enolase superfamily enzyme
VRAAAPDATLIADANEGWSEEDLAANLAACAQAGFALIEQPVPAAKDELLRGLERPGAALRRRERP